MANQKVTEFPALTTPQAADLLHVIDDVAGTPTNRKVLVSDLLPDYARTAAEIAASVTPTNYQYEPGNVLRYGAVGDGVTDSASAINDAVSTGHPVYIPDGTYILEDEITIGSSNNGLLIYGDGPGTILKLKGSVATNYRAIIITDASTQVDGITIRDLALDGNKANRTSTSSRGIWLDGSVGTYAKNITISNIIAHDFDLNGFDLDCETVNIDNIHSYDNGFHGIAVNSSTKTGVGGVGDVINASNVNCYNNGVLGVNISSGDNDGDDRTTYNLTNYRIYNNGANGMKVGCNGIVNLSNGVVYSNTGKGITVLSSCQSVNINNLFSQANTDDCLAINSATNPAWAISTAYVVGDIVVNDTGKSYICVTAGTSAGSGGPTGRDEAITDNTAVWDYFPFAVNINNFQSHNSGSVGLLVNNGEVKANNVHIKNSADQALFIASTSQKFVLNNFTIEGSEMSSRQIDTTGPDARFSNGYIGDSAATYSIRSTSPLSLIGVELADANGINSSPMSAGDKLTLIDVDFTGVAGTHINDTTTPNLRYIACNGLSVATPSFTSADATPSVLVGSIFKTAGTTAITDFDDGVIGDTIHILATASITITDNAAIILNGSANFDMTDTDTLTLTMFNSQIWQEVGRSVN